MDTITRLSPDHAWFDPKTGKPTPEMVRKLDEIIRVVNALKAAAGL